ncbi:MULTISPECIES: hypothetical protein [unclassified Bradyrhizobium]|uniref:hypothetical protein n=1 Tax=unclassified Bradyrhizobium TaxID=2631580 RepID=UPI00041B851E|nr:MULTISPECIES: hypothetical protein [unclassified Bradyrhizobium]MCK7669349.1 hypothetical protein [Bradyrhizobium sp. 2S1]
MNVIWKLIDEETYYDALGVVPPAMQTGRGFQMGEPVSHRVCEIHNKLAPTFHAYISDGNRFFKSDRPLTISESIQACIHPELPNG